jgi:hypothetical protein
MKTMICATGAAILLALLPGCAEQQLNLAAQQAQAAQAPLAWAGDAGEEVASTAPQPAPRVDEGTGVKCSLPAGFTTYYEYDWRTRAVSPAGVHIKLVRRANVKDATLNDWAMAIKRTLETARGMAVQPPRALTLASGEPAMIINATAQRDGKPFGYLAGFTTTSRHVYLFEAWGPQDAFNAALPALEQSVKSIRISWLADVMF